MINFRFTEKEKPSDYEALGNIIKGIISEKGIELLSDTESFIGVLKEKNVSLSTAMQLGLLLEAGNIKNYLTQIKTGVTMIDVNNMVTCAERETGLTKKQIKHLLTVMLYGLSLPTEINVARLPAEARNATADKVFINQKDYVPYFDAISNAVKTKNEQVIAENAAEFESMVSAGVPEALYLKALCYIDGIATEKDSSLGFKYMYEAASAGVAEANAYLGDYYFENSTYEDFSKAFHYYTQLGAVAMSKGRKQNLKVIVAAQRQNITQILLNGVLLVLIFVFNSLLGKGVFSLDGSTNWGWAVTSDILASAIYALQIVQFIRAKYNRNKWATVGMMAVLMLATLFAL